MGGKILLIEDDKAIARYLELELVHEGYDVTIAYNGLTGYKYLTDGCEAGDRTPAGSYDIALVDIMLPGMNGFDIIKEIRKKSDIPLIILTAKDDVKDKVKGLDIGANDYVTKPFAIEELLARIRVHLRDLKQNNKVSLNVDNLLVNLESRQVKRNNNNIILTKTEFDLLVFMIKNKNIVLSRNRILDAVWGFDYMGDTNIVDVYIRYLRSKIDDGYDVKLIHTVRGVGYVLKEIKS